MSWIDKHIDEYYHWLKNQTYTYDNQNTGWTVITTPFIGIFNDLIEIYAKLEQDTLLLSDDGMTLKKLEQVGVSINRSAQRKKWVQIICLNYGIDLENGELTTTGTKENFNQKKHNLTSAIKEISDMDIMAKNTVASVFKEDVRNFLEEQEIIYTPDFIAKGSTGIDFNFDFQIAGRTKEIVIKSFSSVNKTNLSSFLFTWEDIVKTRQKISGKSLQGLAVINDIEKNINPEYTKALESKKTLFILWSQRGQKEQANKLVA